MVDDGRVLHHVKNICFILPLLVKSLLSYFTQNAVIDPFLSMSLLYKFDTWIRVIKFPYDIIIILTIQSNSNKDTFYLNIQLLPNYPLFVIDTTRSPIIFLFDESPDNSINQECQILGLKLFWIVNAYWGTLRFAHEQEHGHHECEVDKDFNSKPLKTCTRPIQPLLLIDYP